MLHMARCARCELSEQKDRQETCLECAQCSAKKDLLEYPAILLKQFFAGRRIGDKWKCFDCYYPACQGWKGRSCNRRPLHVPPHSSYEDGAYLCEQCRYPACMGRDGDEPCTHQRQKDRKYHIKHMPVWYCDRHRPQEPQACKQCGEVTAIQRTATMHQDIAGDWFCKRCAQNHLMECADCGKQVNRNDYAEEVKHQSKGKWRCQQCRLPKCSNCPNSLTEVWNAGQGAPLCSACLAQVVCASCKTRKPESQFPDCTKQQQKNRWKCTHCLQPQCSQCPNRLTNVWNAGHGAPLCSECLTQVVCASCKRRKPESDFPKCTKQQQKNKWKCRDCLQPPCAKCGARPQKPFANHRPRGPYYCSKHQPKK